MFAAWHAGGSSALGAQCSAQDLLASRLMLGRGLCIQKTAGLPLRALVKLHIFIRSHFSSLSFPSVTLCEPSVVLTFFWYRLV
jgi:hypothetical protein